MNVNKKQICETPVLKRDLEDTHICQRYQWQLAYNALIVTTKARVLHIFVITALLYCNNVESGFHQLSYQLP